MTERLRREPMDYRRLMKVTFLAVTATLIAGCGGSQGARAVPSGGTPANGGVPNAVFRLVIPTRPDGTSSTRRVPKYVSPSTQSLSIAVNGGTPAAQTIQTSGPNCTTPTVISPTTCDLPISAPVGNDTFTIVTYDQPNSGAPPYAGNVLSNA
ncbi:MAG TPA: hypothetical protein VGN14_07960, partial [Candidatus Elarobacter sp.]